MFTVWQNTEVYWLKAQPRVASVTPSACEINPESLRGESATIKNYDKCIKALDTDFSVTSKWSIEAQSLRHKGYWGLENIFKEDCKNMN